MRADGLFQMLKEAIPWPMTAEKRARKLWISDETWKLVDECAALLCSPNHTQAEAHQLNHHVKQAFKADRTRRAEAAGAAIEADMQKGDLQGALKWAKAWYRHAGDCPPKPLRHNLRAVTVEYHDLYMEQPPLGAPIPVLVEPFAVLDDCLSEEEIACMVHRLQKGKAPGPLRMRTDHLKEWLAAAQRDEKPDDCLWCILVDLVQHVHETGDLPSELPWETMVLLPKGSRGYRGIGLFVSLLEAPHQHP